MKLLRHMCILLASLSIVTLISCGDNHENDTPNETTTSFIESTTDEPTAPESTTAEITTTEAETTPPPLHDIDKMPRSIYGGAHDTSHVQGIAIDKKREFMYFSFTTKLVKTDMQGNIVGTVENLVGHLGDLDLNYEDGRLYGSFEFKKINTFYIAIFDVDKIDRVGINAQNSDVLTVVPLPDVYEDYTATVGGEKYRYGCSGIDGVAFGPSFGDPSSPSKLMVAYGIFLDNGRKDNDYQIILEFDWRKFAAEEKPFRIETRPDTDGPSAEKKYFIYTGNTKYGVQNLEYDAFTGYWFMAVYLGEKSTFPNYYLYAVDGRSTPSMGDIVGQPTPERGLILPLLDMGLYHEQSGVHGWNFMYGSTGLIALDDGYFYISHNSKTNGKQTCTAYLYRWVGGGTAFERVS